MNFCKKCETWKERESFYTRLEKEARCRKCVSEIRKKDYAEDPQKHRDRVKAYRIANPVMVKDTKLKQAFGLEHGMYDKMLEWQFGVCKICRKAPKEGKRLHIDHCHNTGKIRALLCSYCNTSLGLLQESTEIMENMIEYIKSFRSRG